MATNNELWDYVADVFSLPPFCFQMVADIIGSANIEAIIAAATERLEEANKKLQKIQSNVDALCEIGTSALMVNEVRAEGARSALIKQNMSDLIKLLTALSQTAVEPKCVLPPFRGVKHFAVGDEVMLYIGDFKGDRRLKRVAEYDWISGKVLYPGWDCIHCHSNTPWTQGGTHGGHYCVNKNKYWIFKRTDFYGLRKMLEQDEDKGFIGLIPEGLCEKILKCRVEPLTDDELAENQASYVEQLIATVDHSKYDVPMIAKCYGVTV